MKATKSILASAILAAGIFGLPTLVRAQAAAGPIHPAKSSDDNNSAPAAPAIAKPKAPDVPQKRDLSGSWKLNEDQSDDPSQKLKQAQQAGAGNRGGGNGGGSRGGVWGGGGGIGGGYPGGGGGVYGGRRGMGGGGESDADRQKIQDAVNPANALTFKQKDAEIDMTDDQSRKRVFYTDGRKIERAKDKTDDYRELTAHWDGMKLVAEEKGPHGKITRLYEVPAGGQQLRVSVHFDDARGNPVSIHYVYDIVKAEKKDGTSETTITSN